MYLQLFLSVCLQTVAAAEFDARGHPMTGACGACGVCSFCEPAGDQWVCARSVPSGHRLHEFCNSESNVCQVCGKMCASCALGGENEDFDGTVTELFEDFGLTSVVQPWARLVNDPEFQKLLQERLLDDAVNADGHDEL